MIVHGYIINETDNALLLRVESPNTEHHMAEHWLPLSQVDKIVRLPNTDPESHPRAVVTITTWLARKVGLA